MAKKPQGQQVEAEQPNQAEQKMPAERQGGERTRSGRTFRPRVDICETDIGLMLLAHCQALSGTPTITLDRPARSIHAAVEDHRAEGYSPIYQE